MALTAKSMFLYGYQITENNSSLDFRSTSGGPERPATLTLGYYSLTSLMVEVKRALQVADPLHTYTVTADRTIAGGTQNRVTISTSNTYLDLLFGSGMRAASSCADILGFNETDYTGATSYTSAFSSGTILITNMAGYNYLPPELYNKNFGVVNVTTSGIKETIVYSTQTFFQAQFKYIPHSTAISQWSPLQLWMISQKRMDFTPNISDPSTFYDCTLESSSEDGKGLAFKMMEMLPSFPFQYDTGLLKFRVSVGA